MLAMCDKNGDVQASIPGLAKRAGITIDECVTGLETLSLPDPYSRTVEFGGRRIEETEGGWILLNHPKYRDLLSAEDRREYNRRKQAEHRARAKSNPVKQCQKPSITVNHNQQCQHITDADTSTDSDCTAQNQKAESPSFPSSESYDVPSPERSTDEGRKEVTPSFGDKWQKEAVFLKLASSLDIPESYARRVFADLEATGFKAANGSKIVSPGAFLSDLWRREQSKADRQDNGRRQPWQIEADLKRVKAEIAKIEGDKSLRMAFLGHTATWDAHRDKFGSEWLKYVADAYTQAQGVFPAAEIEKFENDFKRHCEEMQKDKVPASMLGEEYKLTKFAEAFPKDVDSFDVWDRSDNPHKWVDPKALFPEAKAEVAVLKQNEKRLENERREALK